MVTAVIMAGGKGTRMGLECEKPLVKIGGLPMIQYVLEALEGAEAVDDLVILTSTNTPKTEKFLQGKNLKVFQTPGKGYVEDLRYFIGEQCSQEQDKVLLTITADMPLVTSEIIDEVLGEYMKCEKPAMCVAVPVEVFAEHGLKPTFLIEDLVPSGLNILRSINKQQNEEILVMAKVELALNINSCRDIIVLEELLRKTRKVKTSR